MGVGVGVWEWVVESRRAGGLRRLGGRPDWPAPFGSGVERVCPCTLVCPCAVCAVSTPVSPRVFLFFIFGIGGRGGGEASRKEDSSLEVFWTCAKRTQARSPRGGRKVPSPDSLGVLPT